MKNLLKNKKGFTLAEILLVIAIIVILSGATVIGVASWLNSSKATAEKIAHDAADFEPAANESVKKKKGTLGSLPQETETLQTGATENNNNNNNDDTTGGNGNSDSGNSGSGNGTGGNGNNSAGETTAAETTAASTTASTQGTTQAQAQNGSGGATNNFTTQSGTHWDPNVDLGYDEWGNHRMGANVPDTTSQGNINFGNKNVSSFTVKVSGTVLWYQCNDWRYSVSDNGDGTYTFTYTANQYKDNPPIGQIAMTFKVDGDSAAKITVTSFTEYKP